MDNESPETAEEEYAKIKEAIEILREELLDLTRRNSLINVSYSRGKRFIHIVDELPSQVCKHLLNQKEFTFESIPDPTDDEIKNWKTENDKTDGTPSVKEVAKWHDILLDLNLNNTSREGVGGRHEDSALQTPYFPKELEARLKLIRREADSQIQETGMNTLYLTIGYLEWFETKNSDRPCLSPLFSIPVTLVKGNLNKKTQTYDYTIQWSGEDLITNISLAKRLERDFNYCLPDISTNDEGEIIEVDQYLTIIGDSIEESFPHWSVQKNGTLSFLNFAKLLMYNDLDTEKWSDLLIHPLVKAAIIGNGVSSKGSDNFSDEHKIDEISDLHESYPLVDSADSSQHSAIIDALDGKNLVIEGPPGTGKSQTITNLISAFLHQGKTVLFVSEKMAALSVVKARMTRLGLEDFTLELHSHATQKLGVIESFNTRLNRKAEKEPDWLENEITKNTQLKEKLNEHARLINTKWRKTELTIAEILTAVTKEKEFLKNDIPKFVEQLIIKDHATPFDREELYRQADSLLTASERQALVCEDGNIQTHPWYGIAAADLTGADKPEVFQNLNNWTNSLGKLKNIIADQINVTDDALDLNWAQAATIPYFVQQIPNTDNVSWRLLRWGLKDISNQKSLNDFNGVAVDFLSSIENSPFEIKLSDLEGIPSFDYHELLALSEKLDLKESLTLIQVSVVGKELDSLLELSNVLVERIDEYRSFSSTPLPEELLEPNLSAFSIGEFISSYEWILQEKEVIDFRHESLLSPDNLVKLEPVRNALDQLQSINFSVEKRYNLENIPPLSELDHLQLCLTNKSLFTKLFSKEYKSSRKRLEDLFKGDGKSFKSITISEHIVNLKNYLNAEADYKRAADALDSNLNQLLATSNLSPSLIDSVKQWHSTLREKHGVSDGKLFTEFKLNSFGKWIMTATKAELMALSKFSEAGLPKLLNKLIKSYDYLNVLCSRDHPYFHLAIPLKTIGETSEFTDLRSFDDTLKLAQDHPLFLNDCNLTDWADYIANTELTKSHHVSLKQQLSGFIKKSEAKNISAHNENIESTLLTIKNTVSLLNYATQFSSSAFDVFDTVVSNDPSQEGFHKLSSWASRLHQAMMSVEKSKASFDRKVSLVEGDWLNDDPSDINALITRCNRALENEVEFTSYVLFARNKSKLNKLINADFVDHITSVKYSPTSIRSATRLGIMQAYALEIFSEYPALQNFQGIDHESYVKAFNESNNSLQDLHRQNVISKLGRKYVPEGERGYRVSEHTELCLISHECNKQKRHIPIRQLLSRAPEAAQALKPCFMMGPRSVAQYLTPNRLKFDVLIIDEASQLKPAEAIGACGRVDKIVVVGDSKQLPPTSFFDRARNDDEDEDEIAMNENESILDAAKGANFPCRILRWHYRSRHESLIAFSNQKFYNNELELFPSPQRESDEYGIKFHYLESGLFENQQNRVEALAIADRVEHLLSKNPDLSLGVAAMNRKQADLIYSYIEQKAKENPQFDRALADNKDISEQLFVKNLETVQGDERDVVIISCTYGQGQRGPTPQRFGPINGEMGWRRLNVLFSRSRERMEVFSSMHHGDVKVSENSSRGVQALSAFLHYAESGHLSQAKVAERPADSDFEVAVADILRKHGYECDYQVGVSGFFIDLAVRHPKCPNRHIMGIECDGATYHSAKSARDRDCLRQEILESLGWKIRRIWSTDWFNNSHQCIIPIIEELKSLSNAPLVEAPENDWQPNVESITGRDELDISAQENDSEELPQEDTPSEKLCKAVKIEVHDTVTIKYVDDYAPQTFTIVYGNSSESRKTLNFESPLARLLVDKIVHPKSSKPLTFVDMEIIILKVEKSPHNLDY